MKWPAMAMIGAAARRVGKTAFACALIRQSAAAGAVGLKITVIREPGSGCPRGGRGCGVCGGLAGNYAITEETRSGERKDTERMLAAGAARVLWLRVRRPHLEGGIRALRRRVPAGVPAVCESNSARSVLEPGVFLVLREAGSRRLKASCRRVLHHADRVVRFGGDGWDFPPERVVFTHGRWLLRQEASAIILAGGRSRRMGRDKSLLPVGGEPMIQRIANQLRPVFDEVLIGSNDPDRYRFLGLAVVPDLQPDCGPLMGILSGVTRSSHELSFITGCDIPVMHADLILDMLKAAGDGYDVVLPEGPNGDVEPLFAVYRKTVMEPARRLLARGVRRVADLFDHVRVRRVAMPDTGWYRNVNTRADYRAAVAAAASGGTTHDHV
jgi:molybdopterin-guanine dinucleotide biosynthesis protein A